MNFQLHLLSNQNFKIKAFVLSNVDSDMNVSVGFSELILMIRSCLKANTFVLLTEDESLLEDNLYKGSKPAYFEAEDSFCLINPVLRNRINLSGPMEPDSFGKFLSQLVAELARQVHNLKS